MRTWKYNTIEYENGVQLIEDYGDSKAILDGSRELWAETKEELIEVLEMMLHDLKAH